MYLIQQTSRNRKESLIPLRSTVEDLKIEILDINTMSGFTVIDGSGYEQVVEVVTSDETSQDENTSSRPRKRAKLDHLSAEQKAQHRKLMNRISAQSARDRQRALMNQQEDSLKKLNTSVSFGHHHSPYYYYYYYSQLRNELICFFLLLSQFEQVKEDNKLLKKRNEALLAENASMKAVKDENKRLKSLVAELESKLKSAEESRTVSMDVSSSMPIETSCSSSEPAVPTIVPLPKGLELQLVLIFTLLIWQCSNGILTLQKFCKLWRTFRTKFSAKIPDSQLET